ncbi:hypothetical protein [Haloarcula litorea]|uniref:hypothetical protein n=1 Tax=Haloarcula litorea TaxID=3032579 RepID=UPI0023E7DD25|nr:hypothetical protein [Halomicroarcula sp. GDY20]
MGAAARSRGSRRFVLAGVAFLVGWQVALLSGASRRLVVLLGLYGFVLHTVFGKAYALVPSYFDRTLAWPRAPAVQLPLAVPGVAALAVDSHLGIPWLAPVGWGLWTAGVAVFLGTLAWTVRTNPTGGETGTGDANADRRPVDRVANAAVPVVFAYLGAGSLLALGRALGLPVPLSLPAQVSHLLAAGGAALLVFGVGFRLFPRFLVVPASRRTAAVVVAAGAVGPLCLAVGLRRPPWLAVGAVVETVAVAGFALWFLRALVRSERRRIGFAAVGTAAVAGLLGVALGLHFAFAGRPTGLVAAHYRTMLLGFLGLTVVGATLQFYPPSVGRWRLSTDRTARAAVGLLAVGLAAQLGGLALGVPPAVVAGEAGTLAGAALHTALVVAAVGSRR